RPGSASGLAATSRAAAGLRRALKKKDALPVLPAEAASKRLLPNPAIAVTARAVQPTLPLAANAIGLAFALTSDVASAARNLTGAKIRNVVQNARELAAHRARAPSSFHVAASIEMAGTSLFTRELRTNGDDFGA